MSASHRISRDFFVYKEREKNYIGLNGTIQLRNTHTHMYIRRQFIRNTHAHRHRACARELRMYGCKQICYDECALQFFYSFQEHTSTKAHTQRQASERTNE